MPTLYTSLLAKHKSFSPARRNREIITGLDLAKDPGSMLSKGLSEISATHLPTDASSNYRSRQDVSRTGERGKVAIIGAGLAGLCAAYELMNAGYRVKIFEARGEVGGRTKTIKGVVDGKSMDGGAELIGDNHPLWLHFAERFGIELTDARDYGNSPIMMHGRVLSSPESAQLMKRLDKLIKKLTQAAESVVDPFEPWLNPDAVKLDSRSLDDWLQGNSTNEDAKYALRKMLEADGGVVAKNQSLLAVLAMVRGGGLDRYWTDSELHRCHGGSQSLALAFKKHLANKSVEWHLRTQVYGLTVDKAGVKIHYMELPETKNGEDPTPLQNFAAAPPPEEADIVILAIPPSVWHTIPTAEPPSLARLIQESGRPQMGVNVKNLMGFRRRFWQDFGLGPGATEDGQVDMTWETTEADKDIDPEFGLVAFSGAQEAEALSNMNEAERRTTYENCLTPVYRDFSRDLDKSEFVNWPKKNWTMASYCFPAPGEVTKWGPIYKSGFMNRLHFAGEYTCYAYMGYMEGALSSGYRVAARIAVRDEIGLTG